MDRSDESFFLNSKFVTELTPTDFEQVATWKLKDKSCSVVFMYCGWCGYCVSAKDEWEKFAMTAAFIKVYAFNCEKYKMHVDVIKNDMPGLINGYPTIVFYKQGKPIETFGDERTKSNFLKASMRVCKQK